MSTQRVYDGAGVVPEECHSDLFAARRSVGTRGLTYGAGVDHENLTVHGGISDPIKRCAQTCCTLINAW